MVKVYIPKSVYIPVSIFENLSYKRISSIKGINNTLVYSNR